MDNLSEIKKSSRGRTLDGKPNPVDIHVGKRIHARRTLLGISQEKLARSLGLTFQQVQKYERGHNRIGASRLWDISRVLEIPITFFYEEMDKETIDNSPRKLNSTYTSTESIPAAEDVMIREETYDLVRAYYRIRNRDIAKQILRFMEIMSKVPFDNSHQD